MIKVIKSKESKKSENVLKKLLAAGLVAISIAVASPVTVQAAPGDVLYIDDDSDDVVLEDAEEEKPQETKPADPSVKPVTSGATGAAKIVVTQINHDTQKGKKTEEVNDGSVDTSKDTKPSDAKKDPYTGDNNKYFDEYDKNSDSDSKGGTYIDSLSEPEIKGVKHTTGTPTPTGTPVVTPVPEPQPLPKTGEGARGLLIGGASATLLTALYEIRKILKKQQALNAEEVVEENKKLHM